VPSPSQRSAPDSHGPLGLVVRDPESNTSVPELWTDWLQFMVPLCLAEMWNLSDAEIDRIRSECCDAIASHGDDAQFGGRHQGTARTAIAKGLAVLAMADGGVTALGIHACTRSHAGCPGLPSTPDLTKAKK
jgi:hypothetical protein